MNFQALKKEHYTYVKQVLGLDSYFATKETKVYDKLVVLDEALTTIKAEMLNKILQAYKWQHVEIIARADLDKHISIDEALIFGIHLEEDSIVNKCQLKLVAPSLQDLLDEPDLKKVLWRKMQAGDRGMQ